MNSIKLEQNQIQKQLDKRQAEQLLQQIQEQLQLNILQQTSILHSNDDGKPSATLQQLQIQQQQLLAQFHLLQQHFLNDELLERKPFPPSPNQDYDVPSPITSPRASPNFEVRHENKYHPPSPSHDGKYHPSSPSHDSKYRPSSPSSLYQNGACTWTGCELVCKSDEAFSSHMSSQHLLDDKNTAQTRVQLQIVNQLELQLTKERGRLEAMMTHLYPAKENQEMKKTQMSPENEIQETNIPTTPSSIPNGHFENNDTLTSGPIRQRHQEKNTLLDSLNGSHMRERGRQQDKLEDTENELNKNRFFYKTNEVRPPFTYAALIRQAIKESREMQLTLNDIYNWFINNFAYFRQNAATWKNAVRHNLSLHKCFMRVENVKGAVWTVDEMEFHMRRPQRGTSGQNSSQSSSPTHLGEGSLFGGSLNSSFLSLVNSTNERISLFSEGDTRSLVYGGESPPRMVDTTDRCIPRIGQTYNNMPSLVKIEQSKDQDNKYHQNGQKSPNDLNENNPFHVETRLTPPLSPREQPRRIILCGNSPRSFGDSEGPQDLSIVKSRNDETLQSQL